MGRPRTLISVTPKPQHTKPPVPPVITMAKCASLCYSQSQLQADKLMGCVGRYWKGTLNGLTGLTRAKGNFS